MKQFPQFDSFWNILLNSISIKAQQRNCQKNLATVISLLLIFTFFKTIISLKELHGKVSVLGLVILLTRWATMVTWCAQSSAVPYLWCKRRLSFQNNFYKYSEKQRDELPKSTKYSKLQFLHGQGIPQYTKLPKQQLLLTWTVERKRQPGSWFSAIIQNQTIWGSWRIIETEFFYKLTSMTSFTTSYYYKFIQKPKKSTLYRERKHHASIANREVIILALSTASKRATS